MNFNEIIKKKWQIQGFSSCFNFIFHGPYSGMYGCHNKLGYGYTQMLFVFNKDYLEYHYLENDFINIGNEFLKRRKKDKKYYSKLRVDFSKMVKSSQKVMKEVDGVNLKKLSEKKLISLYHKMFECYYGIVSVGHIIEGITFVVEPMLKKKLEKLFGCERHSSKFMNLFVDLMQSKKPSFVNFEFIDLLKIVKEIKNVRSIDANVLKKIEKHKKKYFYNQLDYFNGDSLTMDDYVAEIKKMISEGLDFNSKIKEELHRYANNVRRRNELIKEYKIDNDTKKLIDLLVDVLHWQDDRKMHMLSCVNYLNKLLKELSLKFNIPIDMLKRYAPIEITYGNLLNFDKNDAKKRMDHYVVYMYRKDEKFDMDVYTGKDYDEFMKCYKSHAIAQTDIHGITASIGKASGSVRICKVKEDLSKFKEGEVLVASMTRPEFVPAMKKAAAIVTDEGGVTSHAAIVSREFGIPCIIGTKIATKVLKDGDLVEVNANHGWVKIIK